MELKKSPVCVMPKGIDSRLRSIDWSTESKAMLILYSTSRVTWHGQWRERLEPDQESYGCVS